MAKATAEDAKDVLMANRQAALSYADHTGPGRVRELMSFAEQDLLARIASLRGSGTFTEVNLNAMLRQVRLVTQNLTEQLTGTIVDESEAMSGMAARGTIDYMTTADAAFRGTGTTPIALQEASMFDSAKTGARASVLRRLVSGIDTPAGKDPGLGIMDRYGMNTVGEFEKVLRVGVVTGKGIDQVKGDLTKASPFLQGKPGFWAERIARTELMGAYNRAGWEAQRDVDEQLGGDQMVRILCATFDHRTACLVGTTRLTGAVVRTAFRRRYDGQVLRLVTESGRDLTTTPNHPVLTRRGWVAACTLRHGDDLVCDDGQKESGASRYEDDAHGPPTLHEVFDSLLATARLERRRGGQHDFHGDGSYGEIDVLRPDGVLRYGRLPAFFKPTAEKIFAPSNASDFCSECDALLGPDQRVRGRCLRCASQRDAGLGKTSCDECLRDIVVSTDLLQRLARLIAPRDVVDRYVTSVARMLAHVSESFALRHPICAGETALFQQFGDVPKMSTERRRDVAHGHPARVKLDRLVLIEESSFRGHVFNLATVDGYYTANGVYSSNSDSYAVHGQIRRPEEAFETWYGMMQHPPARPNDREIVVPHKISWPIPPHLKPKSEEQVAARWAFEGRKEEMPERPLMTTVPLEQFGKPQRSEEEAQAEEPTEEEKAKKAKENGEEPEIDPDAVDPEAFAPDEEAADEQTAPGARPARGGRRRRPLLAAGGAPELGAFNDAEQSLIENLTKSAEAEEVAPPEEKPTGDQEGIAKALATRGIDDVHKYNFGKSNSAKLAQVFDGKVNVDQLEGMVSTPDHKATLTEAFIEGNGVMMKYSLRDGGGNEVAMVQHRYDRSYGGEKSMHLQNFFINDGHQGQGIGETVMRQTVRGMQEQGMDHISLDAHAIGRYTWSSFGFSPTNPDMMSRALVNHLTTKEGLDVEPAKKIADAVVTTPGDLARLHIDGKHVGKEFLLGAGSPNWKGRLSLRDGDPGLAVAKKRLGL